MISLIRDFLEIKGRSQDTSHKKNITRSLTGSHTVHSLCQVSCIPNFKMSTNRTALVIGAFGIAGNNMIRHLVEDQSWSKIYGVARKSPPPGSLQNDKIAYIQCDVSDVNQCKEKLGPIANEVTHIFYQAWVKCDTEEEMEQVNGKMFRNVVTTIDTNGKSLKHVILQTGTKYYGCHLGPFKTPAVEDQPRHKGPDFYFVMEDFLTSYATSGRSQNKFSWNIFRPHDIIGFTTKNQMNLGTSLAVYASLCRELKRPFAFTGAPGTWTAQMDATDVDLLCRMMCWACDTPQAHNQAFNAVNGDFFTYKELWPKLASYFGLDAPSEPKPAKLEEQMKKEWNAENVWKDMAKKYNLKIDDVNDLATWWFMDQAWSWAWDNTASMEKARKFGFNDKVDTVQMYYSLFEKLERDKIIPPFRSKTV